MSRPLRVAVAGASGIGRHHANWHARSGADVVAFLGSQPDRCRQTTAQLTDLFGFSGKGYTRLDELLEQESPDVVDVCLPNDQHYDCVTQALDAGCHVLCEKPLVWDDRLPAAQMLAQGHALCERAVTAGRHLGMCTQYAAAIDHFRRLVPGWDAARPSTFEAELETLARGRQRDAASVWVDMGSHPLSLILAVMPQAEIVADSLRVRFHGRTAEADFRIVQGDVPCDCRVIVSDREEGPPVRRFAFDGRAVDCSGRPGDDGVYRAVLSLDGREDVAEDYMSLLIGQFHDTVAGRAPTPMVPADVAVRNLALQLRIREAA